MASWRSGWQALAGGGKLEKVIMTMMLLMMMMHPIVAEVRSRRLREVDLFCGVAVLVVVVVVVVEVEAVVL